MNQDNSPYNNMPPQPQPNRSNTTHPAIITRLAHLGHIIETGLQNWLTHLSQMPPTANFSDITSNPATHQTKTAALRHLLQTLPSRHKALATAYNAENVEPVELSDQCALLLEGLEKADLSGAYDHKLFRGTKFRQEAIAMDEEMRALEQGRSSDLKEVMGLYEELVILKDEDILEEGDLQLLVEAMDEIGISAVSAMGGQADVYASKGEYMSGRT